MRRVFKQLEWGHENESNRLTVQTFHKIKFHYFLRFHYFTLKYEKMYQCGKLAKKVKLVTWRYLRLEEGLAEIIVPSSFCSLSPTYTTMYKECTAAPLKKRLCKEWTGYYVFSFSHHTIMIFINNGRATWSIINCLFCLDKHVFVPNEWFEKINLIVINVVFVNLLEMGYWPNKSLRLKSRFSEEKMNND